MSKKMSPLLLEVIVRLGSGLIRLLGFTWKYNLFNEAPTQRVIYAFWHRNLLPLMYLHKNQGIAVLVSQSQDGELIAKPAKRFGYNTVRGSSKRGGSRAVREMARFAKKVNLGITPDGPKGPVNKIKEGIVLIAKITGIPIVLVAVDVDREKLFKSWDRFRLPLPGAKIKVIYGREILVDKETETKEVVALLESEMAKLEEQVIS